MFPRSKAIRSNRTWKHYAGTSVRNADIRTLTSFAVSATAMNRHPPGAFSTPTSISLSARPNRCRKLTRGRVSEGTRDRLVLSIPGESGGGPERNCSSTGGAGTSGATCLPLLTIDHQTGSRSVPGSEPRCALRAHRKWPSQVQETFPDWQSKLR